MPKLVDHVGRRRAIAGAAVQVIDELGLDAARLVDVARAGLVTTGAVTHYFDSKDALLEAALSEVVTRILESQAQTGEASLNSGELIDTVAAFLPLDQASLRDWRVWFALLCCDTCGDPGSSCCPVTCCAPADACGNGCNADPSCCAPAACGNGCNADPSCCAPAACGDNGCCDAGNTCGEGCDCCNDDACEIAKLIYTSMTACHGSERRRALDKLGRKFDCCCHPEIMNAFVYGLNDTDERVRREAADEIGDQVRRNKCCCSPCVVSALTCALADCDRSVRREAEQALRNCGSEIVDGCCDGCSDAGCCSTGCGSNACGATPTAAPAEAQQPTPAAEAAPVAAPAQMGSRWGHTQAGSTYWRTTKPHCARSENGHVGELRQLI